MSTVHTHQARCESLLLRTLRRLLPMRDAASLLGDCLGAPCCLNNPALGWSPGEPAVNVYAAGTLSPHSQLVLAVNVMRYATPTLLDPACSLHVPCTLIRRRVQAPTLARRRVQAPRGRANTHRAHAAHQPRRCLRRRRHRLLAAERAGRRGRGRPAPRVRPTDHHACPARRGRVTLRGAGHARCGAGDRWGEVCLRW